jgi:hypothetical protein
MMVALGEEGPKYRLGSCRVVESFPEHLSRILWIE